MSDWLVDIKEGDPPFEPFDPVEDADEITWEISVLHKSDICGKESWGWASDTKIIFSTSDYSKEMALRCANILCNALNK